MLNKTKAAMPGRQWYTSKRIENDISTLIYQVNARAKNTHRQSETTAITMSMMIILRIGAYSFGSSLICLRCRRLISLSKAATTNCPVLSPGSFHCSIESATSCGTLAAIVCDFPLTALVAISVHSIKGVQQYGRNKKSVQHLTCSTPLLKLVFNTLCCLNTNTAKPSSAQTLTGPLTKPLIGVTVMADIQSTQTHPKFTWRFLALSASTRNVIHITAATEREARDQSPAGCVMVFAGRLPVQGVSHA